MMGKILQTGEYVNRNIGLVIKKSEDQVIEDNIRKLGIKELKKNVLDWNKNKIKITWEGQTQQQTLKRSEKRKWDDPPHHNRSAQSPEKNGGLRLHKESTAISIHIHICSVGTRNGLLCMYSLKLIYNATENVARS